MSHVILIMFEMPRICYSNPRRLFMPVFRRICSLERTITTIVVGHLASSWLQDRRASSTGVTFDVSEDYHDYYRYITAILLRRHANVASVGLYKHG